MRVNESHPRLGVPPNMSTGLTYMHSYAATSDFVLQAMVFSSLRKEWLVSKSDLLIECNNPSIPTSLLNTYLSLYPHKRKELIRSTINDGYKCAQILALARHMHAESRWWRYEWVLMINPDVYPSYNASRILATELKHNERDAFFVYLFTQRFIGETATGAKISNRRNAFETDVIFFRPRLLRRINVWQNACGEGSDLDQDLFTEALYYRLVKRSNFTFNMLPRHMAQLGSHVKHVARTGPDLSGFWHYGGGGAALLVVWSLLGNQSMSYRVRSFPFILYAADRLKRERGFTSFVLNHTCWEQRRGSSDGQSSTAMADGRACWTTYKHTVLITNSSQLSRRPAAPKPENSTGVIVKSRPGGLLDAQQCRLRFADLEAAQRACEETPQCAGVTQRGSFGCFTRQTDLAGLPQFTAPIKGGSVEQRGEVVILQPVQHTTVLRLSPFPTEAAQLPAATRGSQAGPAGAA